MDGFVIGIDVGGTKVALAAADLTGRRLSEIRYTVSETGDAQEVLARTVAAAGRLASRLTRDHGPLRSVGAVSPGIVEEEQIRLAPNIPGWESIQLRRTLQAGLPADTVTAGTDAKAAALAEARWGSLAGLRCGVFLNLGTGTSAATVVDGKVLTGAHGAAGEIGYALISPADPGYGASHAPLEECMSGAGLAARASHLLGEPLTAAEVFARAPADHRLQELLDDGIRVLGAHVAALALAVDPARIAVGGGLAAAGERLLGPVRATLQRAVPFPPELVIARFHQDAPLVGALLLALDAARAAPQASAGTPA
jgi:glucokinase